MDLSVGVVVTQPFGLLLTTDCANGGDKKVSLEQSFWSGLVARHRLRQVKLADVVMGLVACHSWC